MIVLASPTPIMHMEKDGDIVLTAPGAGLMIVFLVLIVICAFAAVGRR